MSERATEMKFNQMSEKINKIEEIQKISMEAHETQQTEEKINIRIEEVGRAREVEARAALGRAWLVRLSAKGQVYIYLCAPVRVLSPSYKSTLICPVPPPFQRKLCPQCGGALLETPSGPQLRIRAGLY